MYDQGYAHGLKAATGQLGPRGAGGGRQLAAVDVGKIDAGLLEYGSARQHPTAAAAALVPLPLVDQKIRPAILFTEFAADAVLQFQQVALDGFGLHPGFIRVLDGAAL